MKTFRKILYKIVFLLNLDKTCQVIENICIEEMKKLGIEQEIHVLHLHDGFQSIYLIRIFSKEDVFKKTKVLALLNSLIAKKTSLEQGVDKKKIKLILKITDPLLDSFVSKTDRLKIKNIEYLLSESIKRHASQVQMNFIKTVSQVELDASNSVVVREIEFEEYLSVANSKLRTLIAEKREGHKTFKQDFQNTAQIA